MASTTCGLTTREKGFLIVFIFMVALGFGLMSIQIGKTNVNIKNLDVANEEWEATYDFLTKDLNKFIINREEYDILLTQLRRMNDEYENMKMCFVDVRNKLDLNHKNFWDRIDDETGFFDTIEIRLVSLEEQNLQIQKFSIVNFMAIQDAFGKVAHTLMRFQTEIRKIHPEFPDISKEVDEEIPTE